MLRIREVRPIFNEMWKNQNFVVYTNSGKPCKGLWVNVLAKPIFFHGYWKFCKHLGKCSDDELRSIFTKNDTEFTDMLMSYPEKATRNRLIYEMFTKTMELEFTHRGLTV